METSLKQYLIRLAEKYETRDFILSDPSQFMHRYHTPQLQERAAFVAAAISYGARKQFIPKIDSLLQAMDDATDSGRPYYEALPDSNNTFYRLHTNQMVRHMLHTLWTIEQEDGTLGARLQRQGVTTGMEALQTITALFAGHDASHLIPRNTQSACKRLCMFLRWMVRDQSPVDLGLWTDFVDKRTLIIPMDTHVAQESCRLGLLKSPQASMSAAIRLTDSLKDCFPEDPLRGDFALFGIGVDTK